MILLIQVSLFMSPSLILVDHDQNVHYQPKVPSILAAYFLYLPWVVFIWKYLWPLDHFPEDSGKWHWMKECYYTHNMTHQIFCPDIWASTFSCFLEFLPLNEKSNTSTPFVWCCVRMKDRTKSSVSFTCVILGSG